MQEKLSNKYPLVSIFCFCKNRMKTIRRCIDSIVAQDYPNIEIIVQDGASTDGTLEILQEYGDKINLVSEPDSGAGDAMFRALGRISGEFFGSCLSDEELLPHAVSWAVENLTKYPEAAAIYGDHYLTDIDGNVTSEVKPQQWDFESYFCSRFTPPFCASFFRSSCYQSHGLHEYTGGDEFDFWIRLGAKFPIRHVSGLVAKYAVHPGELSFQKNLKTENFAGRKTAIERLCNDPETPDSIRLLRDKAIASLYPSLVRTYCHIGAWDLAKKHAQQVFRRGGNQKALREIAEQFYKRGMELHKNGQLKEALEYFDLLVKCNVVGQGLHYQRAKILLKSARINDAAQAAHEELKLQPEHHRSKALIRLAETCPERTSQPNQNRLAEELFRIGVEFLDNGNPKEAVKYFNEVLADCPAMPNLCFALATAHVQIGTLYIARQACEIELKLQPEHDGAKRLLERIKKAINEYEQNNNKATNIQVKPIDRSSASDSIQIDDTKRKRTGIIVFGHSRPLLLRNLLESLRRQGTNNDIHVWLDGHHGRSSCIEPTTKCRELVQKEFPEVHLTAMNSNMGIEKLTIDGLSFMSSRYKRIIVLEDDCFPTADAIAEFEQALDAIATRPEVYSVYGHHFLTETEGETITRFQGWGWATTREKLLPVLEEMKRCFAMAEPDYLRWVHQNLTPEVISRLDVTPGRNCVRVIASFFCWDGCTCLVTAIRGLVHKKTRERVIYNCGMGDGSMHFPQNDRFRLPPFNMITPQEVWSYYDSPSKKGSHSVISRKVELPQITSQQATARTSSSTATFSGHKSQAYQAGERNHKEHLETQIVVDGLIFTNVKRTKHLNNSIGFNDKYIIKIEHEKHPLKLRSLSDEIEIIKHLNSRECVSCPRLLSEGRLKTGERYFIQERVEHQRRFNTADMLFSIIEQKNFGVCEGDLKRENLIFDSNSVCYIIDYDQAIYDERFVRMGNVEYLDWFAQFFADRWKRFGHTDFYKWGGYDKNEIFGLFKNDSFNLAATTLFKEQVTTDTKSGIYHTLRTDKVYIEGARDLNPRLSALNTIEFKKGESVLDVGCNMGLFGHYLHDRGCRVTGIDMDGKIIIGAKMVANILNKDIQFKHLDLDTEKIETNYDTICLFSVIHHVKNFKQITENIVQRCNRIILECRLKEHGSKPIGGKWTNTSGWEFNSLQELSRYFEVVFKGFKFQDYHGKVDRDREIISLAKKYAATAIQIQSKSPTDIQENKFDAPQSDNKSEYLVSAVVSTYNSERFIRGCLEDLENQTIADRLEIIIVNSGSQQNEEAIVREFQSRYDNIKYIKTDDRETIYTAWNRAIKVASGKYITNANTDDQHTEDALEKMSMALELNPDKVLVFADQIRTEEVNGQKVTIGRIKKSKFSRDQLFESQCPPGSQPMWRKSVHDVFGYFDEGFFNSGDYEFWFRLTQKFDFLYLAEMLGERFISPDTVSIANKDLLNWENEMVIHKCYEYALQEGMTIGATGISKHPVFSKWPEVNIWKEKIKAKLTGKQISRADYIKDIRDHRTNPVPKLTIVIVTYNKHTELLENLNALNDQTDNSFEVIVVDNSGDLRGFKKSTDKFNFNLCGIELKHNFGPSRARNIGTEFAKGQYIVFLDDDVVADKNLVRNIVEYFENYNICGLRGKVLPKSQAGSEDTPINYDLGQEIIPTACEISSLSAFRKDVLIKMGGFDELLFGSEGMELSYRICKAQKEKIQSILYFSDVIVYHDPRPKGPTRTEKVLRQHRMELLAWRKDHNIKGYKEFIHSLYPGCKAIFENNYKNYTWLINVTLYLHKNFPEEAVEWAEKAVSLKPDGFMGCYILSSLYTWFGRYDEALPLLERIYEPQQNSVMNDNSEFIGSEFEGQVNTRECYVSVCTQLAQCYMETNQFQKVKQVYTDLLNNPNLTLAEEQKADINNILSKLKNVKSQPSTQRAGIKSTSDSITSHRLSLNEQQNISFCRSGSGRGFIATTFHAGLCNRIYEWTLLRELSDYYKMDILLDWPEIKDGTLDLPNTHYFDFSNASQEFLNSFLPINTSSAILSHVTDLNLNQNNNYILSCGWGYNRSLTDRSKRLNEIRLNQVYRKKIESFLAQYGDSRIVGLHVRRGDYRSIKEFKTSGNFRIPDSWYLDVADKVLARFPDTKFFLATDGTDDEKKVLLHNLPIISICSDSQTPRQDVLELFTLTKLPFIIASVSTFSMFAREYRTQQVQIWPTSPSQQIDEQLQRYQSCFPETPEHTPKPTISVAQHSHTIYLERFKTENTGISPRFLTELSKLCGADVFVETGTYFGNTADTATRIFREVHTIELSPELYRKALQRFAKQKSMYLYSGDSGNILPVILPKINGRFLFWLDGHCSGEGTAKGETNTPILKELQAIKLSNKTDSIIIVDDMRFYLGQWDYPTAKDLRDAILHINENYEFAIIGDMALAYPRECCLTVSTLIRACTISRIFEEGDSVSEAIEAEKVIAAAQGQEREVIQHLYNDYISSEKAGLGAHYRLWYGLTLLNERLYAEASRQFEQAIKLGCNHWRVFWYLAESAYRAGDFALARKSAQAVKKTVLNRDVQQIYGEVPLSVMLSKAPGVGTRVLENFDRSKVMEVHKDALTTHKSSSIAASENADLKQSQMREERSKYIISAIVSTYNSEKFLSGCLEDLAHQTIADKLEIIVVNSGSQENEEAIVHEYQQKYDNIVYIKTEQREGIYSAWNRAAKVARGTFLTNANTDDRHRDDALEIMAETLLANPDIALVYGDQICSDTPNCSFANHHDTNMAKRPEYSFERLLFGCCVGSQPMWRKTLHNEFGYFDETLTCAGDWDFWLRISNKYKFKHIPEFLGLYYHNENGIEHGNKIHSLYERYIVGKRYGNPYISVIPLYHNINNPLVSVITPAYNAAEHIAATIESVLIQNYRNFELIVINDGSTDNTKDIITDFNDNKIRYFYKENAGPASARNVGIKKSQGSFLIHLDADDMMTPDFIAKHLQEFEMYPEADLVYCDDCLIDENSKPIRVIKRPDYTNRKTLIRDLFHCGFPVVPFRTCIRRSVFDKIGFFDENLRIAEDYDMMRRFIKYGLKIQHLPEALYLRRMISDSLSRNYSIHKAKCHFEVIRRFADTFTYDELFPDVAWDKIEPRIRQLHAKCLIAGTYLAIGQEYVKSNALEYSKTAFNRACSELNDCIKMDPENQDLQQLFQKSQLIQARYAGAPRQVVSKEMQIL